MFLKRSGKKAQSTRKTLVARLIRQATVIEKMYPTTNRCGMSYEVRGAGRNRCSYEVRGARMYTLQPASLLTSVLVREFLL